MVQCFPYILPRRRKRYVNQIRCADVEHLSRITAIPVKFNIPRAAIFKFCWDVIPRDWFRYQVQILIQINMAFLNFSKCFKIFFFQNSRWRLLPFLGKRQAHMSGRVRNILSMFDMYVPVCNVIVHHFWRLLLLPVVLKCNTAGAFVHFCSIAISAYWFKM